MTLDQLRGAREASPFQPFTIHLADGRSHRVPHRDYLSLAPAGRTVIVYGSGDSFSILDLMLITEVTVDTPAGTVTGPAEA